LQVRGRRLHFGVQLLPQRTTWATYTSAVQELEQLEFDSIWTFDHMLPYSGPDDGTCFETLTTLGAIAATTERLRLGALVNGVLYRDPATLARSSAMLDQISGGRLEFSLGAAWARREFETYGLTYRPLAERYACLDEGLQIVKSLWTRPRTTFVGRYYRVMDAPCEPKPVQLPTPPIMVGGAGVGSLRLAARHATSSNAHGSSARAAERAALLRGFCEEAGRSFDEIELSLHTDLALASTHEEAEASASRVAASHGHDFHAQVDNWVLGTPDEVIEQLHRYVDAGVSQYILHLNDPFDMTGLYLFQSEVLPAFR
jgi:alkanesulfonate monooxygenase SsuD/methylene tetrahydromethanopterin reductase-like flavin-dependent oxidoreductase (luciferase family)